MLAPEGDERAHRREVASLDVGAEELAALGEAEGVDGGGGGEDGVGGEVGADFFELGCEVAEEGCALVGGGAGAEVDVVHEGAGVDGFGEGADLLHAGAGKGVAEAVPDYEWERGFEVIVSGGGGAGCRGGGEPEGQSEEGGHSLVDRRPCTFAIQPPHLGLQPYKSPPSLFKERAGYATISVMAPAIVTPAGQQQSSGPHPSYIQVAKPFVFEQKIQGQIIVTGANPQREDTFRLQGVQWIDDTRRALQLPVRTFDTAVIYYHKFRLVHRDTEYASTDAAAAALFAACKIEDTLKKSREILCAAYNLKTNSPSEHLAPDDSVFDGPSKTIIGLERLMLEASGFDYRNRYPQKYLIKLGRECKLDKDVSLPPPCPLPASSSPAASSPSKKITSPPSTRASGASHAPTSWKACSTCWSSTRTSRKRRSWGASTLSSASSASGSR
ncbi:hypothetical protein V490_01912 [Pseudogymnoascus sp. VKM F-3557]|nr:hypothetical protein V490_01912 [Pseudogymnoascus sp. VKM F-3557]